MHLQLRHRSDRFLHEQVAAQKTSLARQSLQDGMTTSRYKILIKFLDDRLIGRQFRGPFEIQEVVNGWSVFAAQWGLDLQTPMNMLVVDFDPLEDEEGVICTFKEGSEGRIVCAEVYTVRP